MAASRNMLDLLRLFTLDTPAWKVERIAQALQVSNATAYRYIGQLQRAGLVDSSTHGNYTLGPAFIEFDRLIRLGDPMLKAAAPRMKRLRRTLGAQGAVQLWRCYRDCVVLVHVEASPGADLDAERGRVVSLFNGAPSVVILAALPARVLRRLFRKRTSQIEAAKLGSNWREFSLQLRAIETAGWCAARSVVTPDAIGIASAIHIEGTVLGSLCVELPAGGSDKSQRKKVEAIGQRVHAAAARVAAVLAGSESRFAGDRP